MDKAAIIEKVKKLLALGASSNEAEAALAMEKAHELLARYDLELEDVKGTDKEPFGIYKVAVTSSYPWRRQIGKAVCMLYFCEYAYEVDKGGKKGTTSYDTHYFIGAEHNALVAQMMFEYLHTTVDRLAREAARNVPPTQRSPFRVSFRWGCTMRLLERIDERIAKAKAGTTKASEGGKLPALQSLYEKNERALATFMQNMPLKETPQREALNKNMRGAIEGMLAGDDVGLDAQVENKNVAAHMIGKA